MPVKPSQILDQLNQKREEFTRFDKTAMQELQQYGVALANMSQRSHTHLLDRLGGIKDCGARPLEPWGESPDWIMPSHLVWQSREQSMDWVRDRLSRISTFAVDGSQIYPSKDFSIPIALVQIGWYENFHLPSGEYEKDIKSEVLTPSDLRVGRGDLADRKVNLRRFEMETERLIQYMEERAGCDTCLAFFDGSLIASFAEAFDEETTNFYVKCIRNLIRASEHYRVPLVGFIDTSTARDLTEMLRRLCGLPEGKAIHDAQLLNRATHEMQWGDRTPLFLCQRVGVRDFYQELADHVAFSYLKTNRDSYPVRLEMPVWVYEAGLCDRVIDWVRAEVIVGGGYPYAIETADQVAVLKNDDRQTFYRLVQDWAEKEDLRLRLSRKMVSKARRR
ncbi:DNA double-strand break repair nuclease NurA [Myxacorys almedinensis]|uniref:DNA double-strand break repair nuclease NurA n=1 Tax=Myxacorys almedinensis A TaxID=2690445 RepID=A0A8J7Z2G0_9CYAN|nr:DNA double-strand break repair nuclease NurA [Myxacorys almedinensis]NDJ16951.1 DNA double-strand break repair nuclease NurA [Myxacorys almedinensis A]